MKIRTRNQAGDKIEMQMSSMIDVVFQLLIFFMLTLKIIEPEGAFDINMPLAAAAKSNSEAELQPFKVRMTADPDTGKLAMLTYNGIPLGNGPDVFVKLNSEILKSVKLITAAGPSNLDKQEVEINPDYMLKYEYIISAISACSGKMEQGKMVRYIQRIKFAPINEKPAGM